MYEKRSIRRGSKHRAGRDEVGINKKENIEKELEYYCNLPYTVIVERWDDGEGPYWLARVVELPHCIIHGDTPEEAVREIEEVKRDWIKSNLERGLNIPEPVPHKHSGQISLRIPPSLHKMLSDRAIVEDVSLNQYMNTALAGTVGLPIKLSGRSAQEADEATFAEFSVKFHGENKDYDTSYKDGKWHCSCHFFLSWGICSHTMALEKILASMLPPEALTTQYDATG
jgi:antitoxin HicB